MKYKKTAPHAGFIALSLAAHVAILYPVVTPGVLDFGGPVYLPETVIVDLAPPVTSTPAPDSPSPRFAAVAKAAVKISKAAVIQPRVEAPHIQHDFSASPVAPPEIPAAETDIRPVKQEAPPRTEPEKQVAKTAAPIVQPPLRKTDEFLSSERETLTYQVKLRGVPLGSARLEADTTGGEFRISLTMSSTPGLSVLYPVQNQIETRHIGGNFIITKMRQQEGSFRSDKGFTINLRDKSVFWADLLKRRSQMEKIPTSDVLDPFSALYYLRNRQLEVGHTELLHVYDGDAYVKLPVEVLRRETIQLSSLVTKRTLVLRPKLSKEAVFRRTGDMLIWVTDDEFKVPVKVESSILLGTVTAELVSSEIVPAVPANGKISATNPSVTQN